jgi:hypothetical protein
MAWRLNETVIPAVRSRLDRGGLEGTTTKVGPVWHARAGG